MRRSEVATVTNPATWVTATVLLALARRCLVEGGSFTAAQLADMTAPSGPTPLTPEQRVHASSRLCALGFVKHRVALNAAQEREDVYTVTAEGAAAIQAAGQGHVRKSGPKGQRAPNPLPPKSITARLWQLMRMRKMLDSDTAAQTLCTAGEQDFKRMQATVRRTLARWAAAGVIAESKKRVPVAGQAATSNGCKRYVLLQDQATPPRNSKAGTTAAQQGAGR